MSALLAVAFGLLIGLSLGALGGGGSILTVPVLVYAIGQSAQDATTGSLVIVGITAAVAAAGHACSGRVRWGAGVAFGAAGVLASLAGTRLNARVSPTALLVSFAVLMVVAATAMLAKRWSLPAPQSSSRTSRPPGCASPPAPAGGGRGSQGRDVANSGPAASFASHGSRQRPTAATALKVVAAGLVVGFLTGFLGVGGGFVIVPALVLSLRYDMPTAVGTSLLVISLNSVVALLARGATRPSPGRSSSRSPSPRSSAPPATSASRTRSAAPASPAPSPSCCSPSPRTCC